MKKRPNGNRAIVAEKGRKKSGKHLIGMVERGNVRSATSDTFCRNITGTNNIITYYWIALFECTCFEIIEYIKRFAALWLELKGFHGVILPLKFLADLKIFTHLF